MTKNAIYWAKNAVKNQTFFQMHYSVRIFNAFYTNRNLRFQNSNVNSEACMQDINTIQVLSGDFDGQSCTYK